MTYALQIFLGMFIVVFQTTTLGRTVPVLSSYDLMVPFVLCAGLFRPFREGLIVVIVCGLAMDVYSGAPPWLYFVSYCWLFMVSRWLPSFLHADNFLFLVALCAAGVLFQEMMLQLALWFMTERAQFIAASMARTPTAILCGGLSGPFVILIHYSMLERERKRRARRERFV